MKITYQSLFIVIKETTCGKKKSDLAKYDLLFLSRLLKDKIKFQINITVM